MRVVISRFFNESYLMPWWLKHHREIFDHGILIDSNSTDDTSDICRTLAPDWEIVKTEVREFTIIMTDFEVMKHEARFPDAWKIALNTSEFLVTPGLSKLEGVVIQKGYAGVALPGAIMVDTEPDKLPSPDLPLMQQKNSGFWEEGFDFATAAILGHKEPTHGRVYHRFEIGAYAPGRHRSLLPGLGRASREDGAIWWYGFSPWTEAFRTRKRQFANTIGEFDKRFGWGVQHYAELETIDDRWNKLRAFSRPLSGSPEVAPL
jgi:Glycosyl transferase family 2